METKFTPTQLSILCESLKQRYKENPSLFTIKEPPYHTFKVATSPSLEISFRDEGGRVHVEAEGEEYVSRSPWLWDLVNFVKFHVAKRKIWAIAEDLLNDTQRKGDKLLYQIVPELTERHMK